MMEGKKTYISALVVFLAEMSRAFDMNIGDTEGITESVMTVLGVIGVMYGRFVAKPK